MMVRVEVRAAAHAARRIDADPSHRSSTTRTRCPCGVHYCRITPEGKLTPCPYTPGQSRATCARVRSREVWRDAPLFAALRGGELRRKVRALRVPRRCAADVARAPSPAAGDLLAADPSCAYEPTGDRP